MIKFNPDGSIKLPEAIAKSRRERENKLKNERCVLIRKEMVSIRPPKKCVLCIKVSDAINEAGFVEKTYHFFRQNAEVPAKLTKINEKEFEVEIGTSFRRCTECNSFVRRLRDFLDDNVIEDKGSCSFEQRNFAYEDYFE